MEGAQTRGESEEGLEEEGEMRKAELCHGPSWRGERREGAEGGWPWAAKCGRKGDGEREGAARRRVRGKG